MTQCQIAHSQLKVLIVPQMQYRDSILKTKLKMNFVKIRINQI